MKETNELCLTKKEKMIFSLLGLFIVLVTGILIVQIFSQNERTLESVYPVTALVSKVDANYDDKKSAYSVVGLKEENTDKAQIAYVTKLESSKQNQELNYSSLGGTTTPKNNPEIKETQTEENTSTENSSILDAWDFPSDIITQAEPNTTIKINNQIKLKNGKTATAFVTIRKLVNDTYMIEKVKNNSLTLTEGTYKYYYTYGNITKEKELIVKSDLKVSSVKIPNINLQSDNGQKLEGNNQEKHQEIAKNSTVAFNDKTINLRIKNNNIKTEIPLYLEIDKEQMADITSQQNNNEDQDTTKQTVITTDTYGIILDTAISNNYESLSDNELVMWINLEIISTTGLIDLSFNIGDNTYHIKLDITYLNNQPKNEDKKLNSEDNNLNNDNLDIQNNLEEDNDLSNNQNNDTMKDKQTTQDNKNQFKQDNEKEIAKENKDINKINQNNYNNNLTHKKVYRPINIKNTTVKDLPIKDRESKSQDKKSTNNSLNVIDSHQELIYQTQDISKLSISNEVGQQEKNKQNNQFKENQFVENNLLIENNSLSNLNNQDKVENEKLDKEKYPNKQNLKEDVVSKLNSSRLDNLNENNNVISKKENNKKDNNNLETNPNRENNNNKEIYNVIEKSNENNNEYKRSSSSLNNIDGGSRLEESSNQNPPNKLCVKT